MSDVFCPCFAFGSKCCDLVVPLACVVITLIHSGVAITHIVVTTLLDEILLTTPGHCSN
jgi:hypothetical protein